MPLLEIAGNPIAGELREAHSRTLENTGVLVLQMWQRFLVY